MAKPFSIQSPEDIAKEYAGNKQRIAQAMQLGIVDPTAGVLAGMFIDRMRSAQAQEGVPQATVAQQVMGGAPPVPAPPLPAGGLGATSQAAPPMTPEMGMAPEMGMTPEMGMAPPMPAMPAPQEAPMGMADGGLAMLPVPDAMFDEPTNGGYAGGGIVAFAKGGISDLYDDVEYWESGGKQGAVSPKGARGVMQLMPDTMRDPGFGVRPMQADTEEENRRVGQEYLDAMFRRYGDKKVALAAYNWGPGNVDKWLKSGADPKKLPKETRNYISNVMGGKDNISVPERDIGTAEGRVMAPLDIFEALQSRFGRSDEEKATDARVLARAEEMASPEFYEKQRKASMWETLAEIGFNMASSKSPFLLQAVGEAAAAAMPGAKVARKEREALKDRALDVMQSMNGLKRKENRELLGIATDMAYKGMQQKQFEETMDLKRDELAQVRDLALAELDAKTQAALAKATGNSDGGTELDRIAQTIFDRYRLLQRQGKYVHDRGDPNDLSPGMQVAAQEIKVRAYKEAAELLGKGGGAAPAGLLNSLPAAPGAPASGNSYAGFSAEEVE
jgi:hypothetical protein